MENTPRTCTTRDIYRFLREETMVDIKNTARSVEADPSGSILRGNDFTNNNSKSIY